jgi:hypothetical protein
MTALRLCSDCRFSERTRTHSVCNHPTSVFTAVPDRVAGTITAPYPELCENLRIGGFGDDLCGPDAVHWEARVRALEEKQR